MLKSTKKIITSHTSERFDPFSYIFPLHPCPFPEYYLLMIKIIPVLFQKPTHLLILAMLASVSLISCGEQVQEVVDDTRNLPVDSGDSGPSGGEWLSYGLDLAETRYSLLDQINVDNIDQLGLSWSYDVGPGGGVQEASPLVWNGALYGITNWSIVFAVDARTGDELWRWDPEVNQATVRSKTCCGIVQRGVALYEGMIIAPVLDGRLVALDAQTGRPIWESRVAYSQENHTITMAPRIAKDKVIIGAAGGEFPTRGFFSAFDALTGELAWTFYTVPGNPAEPFENEAMRVAAETWDGEWWRFGGGGSVWDSIAYDPDTNLVFVGTGNGGPWPESLRQSAGKDNLYVSSILAVNADSGELEWYYQNTPGDSWDYDSTQGFVLTDLIIDGRERNVLMQANKNGFYYVLDRVTGEFISAEPFARLNWASGIDEVTGRPIINPDAHYDHDNGAATVYPSNGGAHNWSPMSYNPDTGLVYIPASMGGNRTFVVDPGFEFNPAQMNTGVPRRGRADPALVANPKIPASIGPDGEGDMLLAWDPVAQEERWRKPIGGRSGGGTLTTASNLLFQTINDGRLLVYSADLGELLLEIDSGLAAGMAPPITYMIDQTQYIAFMGGTGLGGDNPIMPKLFTFSLGGTQTIPQNLISEATGDSDAGAPLYRQTCLPCHGEDGLGGPAGGIALADIARNPAGIIAAVTAGQGKDMPAFQLALSTAQIRDVSAYISQDLFQE
jgi:quinohemoprotein ethanol dehydrogenase